MDGIGEILIGLSTGCLEYGTAGSLAAIAARNTSRVELGSDKELKQNVRGEQT